jgi:hypothetical protein
MADCGFDDLASMPGNKLQRDLYLNNWLRL